MINQLIYKNLHLICWRIVNSTFFRISPTWFFQFRNFLLVLFGASLESNVKIYPTVKIYNPKNLFMKENSTLGPYVNCYNVDKIFISKNVTVSQNTFLCTASHDYNSKRIFTTPVMDRIDKPITIGSYVWIAADCFIAPGVLIEEGTVVFARSSVIKSTESWKVYGGVPARFIKKRELL